MRYALIRFKGEPTMERPVGMNDIIGLSEYKSVETARRFLWYNLHRDSRGIDLLRAMAEKGYSHFGLYEVPSDFNQQDKLVQTFNNPLWHEDADGHVTAGENATRPPYNC